MREGRGETRINGRGKRWSAGTDELLARLTAAQKAEIRRARAGCAPGFILGPHNLLDTGTALDAPLQTIDDIARELLRGYVWPEAGAWPTGDQRPAWPRSGFAERRDFEDWHFVGPDWRPVPGRSRLIYDRGADEICPQYDCEERPIEGRPDFRGELLHLILLIAETRAALADRRIESAMMRAMTIGCMFGRISVMLLDGSAIASSAANALLRHRSWEAQRENSADRNAEREAYIKELDSKIVHVTDKTERAKRIKNGWPIQNRSRVQGLDDWVAEYNKDTQSADKIRTLSVGRIARLLPTGK